MEWKFKKNAEPPGSSDDFWYALNNGYITPEEVLADLEQLQKLEDAVELLNSFEQALEDNDLRIEF